MSRTTAITGAASGIGAALTEILRARGERVITVDLKDADVCANLSTPDGRAEAVEGIRALAGDSLDGLVTSAGVAVPGPLMVSVNFFGTTSLVSALQPLLAASPAPRVGLVGSIAGTDPFDAPVVEAMLADDETEALRLADVAVADGRARQLYPSSKSAIAQWARRTSIEPGWADAGIALNVVAPGVVLTPMSEGIFDDPRVKQAMDAAVPMPLNGYAGPEVIARVLAFVVEEQNTHMTGQVIYVDGGAEVTLRPASHY